MKIWNLDDIAHSIFFASAFSSFFTEKNWEGDYKNKYFYERITPRRKTKWKIFGLGSDKGHWTFGLGY